MKKMQQENNNVLLDEIDQIKHELLLQQFHQQHKQMMKKI